MRLVLSPPALGSSGFAQLSAAEHLGQPLSCPIKDFSPRGDVGLGVSSLPGLLVIFKGFQCFENHNGISLTGAGPCCGRWTDLDRPTKCPELWPGQWVCPWAGRVS